MFLFLSMLLAPITLLSFEKPKHLPMSQKKAPDSTALQFWTHCRHYKSCQKLIFSTELNESSSLSAGDYISLPIHNNLNPSSANYFNRNLPNHLHQWLRVLLFHTLQFGLLFFFPTHLLNVQNTQSHTLELIWTDLIPLGSTDFNRATLT